VATSTYTDERDREEMPIHTLSEGLRLGEFMLVHFSVSNFRSFSARQVFSLVANKRLRPTHESHKISTGTLRAVDLSQESNGTIRLLDLLYGLHCTPQGNGIFVIDEIERHLHPMLVHKYLEYFLHTCTGIPCQIIATTHETHLMDLDLLRRDEIWFASKDSSNATVLFALAELNVRSDLRVRRRYMTGQLGAVPFLEGIDQLMAQKSEESLHECPRHTVGDCTATSGFEL
jgi:AAA15 family ATPase/GTPase